jgi:hypothetical protein
MTILAKSSNKRFLGATSIQGFQWQTSVEWSDVLKQIDKQYQDTLMRLSKNQTIPLQQGFNALFTPDLYKSGLFNSWPDDPILGTDGVEGLTLDQRHLPSVLTALLCLNDIDYFREYLSTLIDLAWPTSAKLNICCNAPAAIQECTSPDYAMQSITLQTNGEFYPPPVFAPHFLTPGFEEGQQQVLTAGFIMQLRVPHTKMLTVEVSGVWDLGLAGTRFHPRDRPDIYSHELGATFGNMFLDCYGNDGLDLRNTLCQASLEIEHHIGRDALFHGIPLFTCHGGETNENSTNIDGYMQSCFAQDMKTAKEQGCGYVAAIGACDDFCLEGYCGANKPPQYNKVVQNVIYVHVSDQELAVPNVLEASGELEEQSVSSNLGYFAGVSVTILALFVLMGFCLEKYRKIQSKKKQSQSLSKPPTNLPDTESGGSRRDSNTMNDGEDDVDEGSLIFPMPAEAASASAC